MENNFFEFSPEFLRTLKMIEDQQNRVYAALEPARRQQAMLDAALAPARAQVAHLSNVMTAYYEPILELTNRYQEIVDNIVISIPSLDKTTSELLSSLSPIINESLSTASFPHIPSDEYTEEEYRDLVVEKFEQTIGPEVISEIHQSYEEASSDISVDDDLTDILDASSDLSELRSDLTSKAWHARIWIEGAYNLIVGILLAYIFEYITEEVLNTVISSILEILSNS